MMLDISAAKHMAQEKANLDNAPISLYQRKTGEFIIGRDITLIKAILGQNEQLIYIETLQPEVLSPVRQED